MKKELHEIPGKDIIWTSGYRGRSSKGFLMAAHSNIGTGHRWFDRDGQVYIKVDARLWEEIMSRMTFKVAKSRTRWHLVGAEMKEPK